MLYGSAEQIPLPEASVDVVHARFAYFFPHPRWDVRPGLDEVTRVLRPGGALVVIDNDTERGQFAELLRASTNAAAQGQDTYAREWWAGVGAETREVMSSSTSTPAPTSRPSCGWSSSEGSPTRGSPSTPQRRR